MTYSASIQKQVTVDYEDCPSLPAVLSMTVQSVVGFNDMGLFVYRIDPDTGVQTFSHVATPCDLDTYVFGGTSGDFVRKAAMTKTYATAVLADAAIAEIETSVQTLCNLMEKITVLAPPTTVVISS